MTIQTTKRKPGKIDVAEVKRFQQHYGLQVDGRFGIQSMGQVFEIERAYNELAAAPKQKVSVWPWLAAAGATIWALASGGIEWLKALF